MEKASFTNDGYCELFEISLFPSKLRFSASCSFLEQSIKLVEANKCLHVVRTCVYQLPTLP